MGGLFGSSSASAHPELKEAVERAIIRVRSLAPEDATGARVAGDEVRAVPSTPPPSSPNVSLSSRSPPRVIDLLPPRVHPPQEIFRPFLMACETSTASVAALGLSCVQKLAANDALSPTHVPSVVRAIGAQADSSPDESVHLRCLQASLTILQSTTACPTDPNAISDLIAPCFRLAAPRGGGSRGSPAARSAAAATARQVADVVFARARPDPSDARADDLGVVADENAAALSSSVRAALLLFRDLCAMATGAEATRLAAGASGSTSAARAFALEAAENALRRRGDDVFAAVPACRRAVTEDLCAPLLARFAAWNAEEGDESSPTEGRAAYRCAATAAEKMRRVAPVVCDAILRAVVEGLEVEMAPWRRSRALETLRGVVKDAERLGDVYAYAIGDEDEDAREEGDEDAIGDDDEHPDSNSDVARTFRAKTTFLDVARILARVVQAGSAPQPDSGVDDIPGAVAGSFREKARGVDPVPANEDGAGHIAYAVFLAVDAVVATARSLETIADAAADESDEMESDASRAKGMIASTWETLLSAMSTALSASRGEAMTLELLRGYQAMTQACGVVGANDARDAFLASLCHFALAPSESDRDRDRDRAPVDASTNGPRSMSSRDFEPAPGIGAVGDRTGLIAGAFSLGVSAAGAVGSAAVGAMASPVRGALSLVRGGGSRSDLVALSDARVEVVLTPKNIQALRTLFNVAHRLAATLGTAWEVILETLGALERALDSPSTTTAEKAALGPAGHRRNGSRDGADGDLAVLTAAAEQLFASSATFEEPALLSLLDAVREVSAREHAAMGGGGGKAPVSPGARLFMLERMVDVLLANGRRAHVLWPTVEAHFFNVVASETSGELCRVACAELGRAVSELVGAGFSPESDADAVERLGVETYEIAVLTPLPRLMAGAVAPEARLGALNVLLSILRERGEKITSGWRVVLSTLAAAANAPPAEGAVSLGWSAVSVVVSDLLPHVPDGVLTEVTTTVAAYARQRHDLGTSLTAVGALWNASDFFGQRVEEMRSPQAGAFMAEMTIVPLFSALRDASVDPRPEVRNSGVRTLVNTLTSHGGKLAPRAWRDCLWHVFFPLLDEIRARAAAASDEEQDATVGSKDGERVVMLVHHSRNTASKQWDETLTLSLGGVGKLARAHFPAVASLDGFDERWDAFLDFFVHSVANGAKETSLAAISALQMTISSHASTPAMPPALFSRCLRAYADASRACNRAGNRAHAKTRAELAASVTRLYGARRAAFGEEDVRTALVVADALARAPEPWRNDGSRNAKPNSNLGQSYAAEETQRACLALVANLAPLDDAATDAGLYPRALRQLLSYAEEAAKGDERDESERGAATEIETQPAATSHAFGAAACAAFANMYRDARVPADDRAATFGAATRVLGAAMATRGKGAGTGGASDDETLWRSATRAMAVAMAHGLPAVHKYASAVRGIEEAWGAVSDAFETLLLGSRGDGRRRGDFVKSPSESPSESPPESLVADETAIEREMLDCLVDTVLSRCGSAPDAARERLVAVLARGAEEVEEEEEEEARAGEFDADASSGAAPNPSSSNAAPNPSANTHSNPAELFPRACLRRLFVLYARARRAEASQTATAIGRLALPALVSTCESVLDRHARAASTPERYAVLDADAPALETVAFVADVVASVARVDRERGGGGGSLVGWLRKTVAGDESRPEHLVALRAALAACEDIEDPRARASVAEATRELDAALGEGEDDA